MTRARLLQLLERAGVKVERATRSFEAGGWRYPAGTYVIRLAQVFGRYAKEMLERQTYPEVRLAPELPPIPPYDVTAWSLGLQMGVGTAFVEEPFEASLRLVEGVPLPEGGVEGRGDLYLVSSEYNDAFTLVNRLLDAQARVRRTTRSVRAGSDGPELPPGSWVVEGVARDRVDAVARELGLPVRAVLRVPTDALTEVRRLRIALYQPWGSNMDEGWTRWVLERYGFDYTVLHPQDFRAAAAAAGVGPDGDFEIPDSVRAVWPPHVADHALPRVLREPLRERFDVVILAHQGASSIVEGSSAPTTPPVYRGGIGEAGVAALRDFVARGGTVVALGSATELLVREWPVPVRNVAADLSSEEFLAPGTIVRIQADPTHPLAWGMQPESYGYFIRSPFFEVGAPFPTQEVSVPVRYPNEGVRASGWLRGEEYLAGKAAVVEVRFRGGEGEEGGGRLVLLGLRAQHRAQTHATFKLLFNALIR